MIDVLPERVAWYIVGPLLGLTVVALYALANKQLGATRAYAETLTVLQGRRPGEAWRVWFFGGLFIGALLAALLRGGPVLTSAYGALGAVVPLALLVPLLFVAGLLMGFGGRWAGGCTSGHGLRGSSELSPASLAATVTFMATAVGVTLFIHLVTGGLL